MSEQAKKMSELIQILSDGMQHSGESIGEKLSISRAAVWKYIKLLEKMGLNLEATRGQGYRIIGGLDLLQTEKITSLFDEGASKVFKHIEVFTEIDSTNEYLLKLAEQNVNYHGKVCLAEKQSAGRGRRGRTWVSPYGKNIYCSLLWRFECPMSSLGGLSLVIALALHEALVNQGAREATLKWPNDLLVDGKKIAGILIEVRGDLVDYCDVVIGFGINVDMPVSEQKKIDQPWTDLKQVLGKAPGRNELVGSVLQNVFEHIKLFEKTGFPEFRERWNSNDFFKDKTVEIHGQNKQVGIAKGVNDQGALIIEQEDGQKVIHGGEVSLRGAYVPLV